MKQASDNIFGFPVQRSLKYSIQGRSYRLGPAGVRMLVCLYETNRLFNSPVSHSVPVSRLKRRVYAARKLGCRTPLLLVIQSTDDPALRRTAIWLRGHLRGTVGTRLLTDLFPKADYKTQIEIVRALRRMSAWHQLDEIVRSGSCGRVRKMAQAKTARDFHERLGDLVKNFVRRPLQKTECPLTVARGITHPSSGKKPKRPDEIREVLSRIRSVVRPESVVARPTSGPR